jgi:CubicO group peptidase (beta-lactamase class C family)
MLCRKLLLMLSAGYLLSVCASVCADQYELKNYLADAKYPDTYWKSSSPEQEGMNGDVLQKSLAYIRENKLEIHSFLIIKNGKLIFEYYGKEKKGDAFVQRTPFDFHELHSVTKSVTAALLGIAIHQGIIPDIKAKVVEFFKPEELKNLDAPKKAMTLENLLTMQSGLEYTEGEDDPLFFDEKQPISALTLLNRPLVATPGTLWNYSSGNSQIIGEILKRTTQKSLHKLAQENLFLPMGIYKSEWYTDKSGANFGGWGLFLTPRDLARFGYLYLHKGRWEGKQVVPESWVTESIKARTKTPWQGDYAYHIWVPRMGGFATYGYMGQDMFILPEHNMIVAFTAALPYQVADKTLVDLVDEFVIAAIKPGR